ncbi:MAG: hypothetical protein ACKVU2_01500 [Saprospiraceae bacterium]
MNDSENTNPPAPLQGRFATPDEEAWHDFRRQSEQETPKRLEEAAKYLSGLISVVFAIFAARNQSVFQQIESKGMVTTALLLLLLALAATLFIIFPLRWRQVSQSAADIERVHRAGVRFKYRMLVLGVLLFLVAMGLLAVVFVSG